MGLTYAVVTSDLIQSPKSVNTLVFSTSAGNVGISKGMTSIINRIKELREKNEVAVVVLEDHKAGDFIFKGGIATRDSATLNTEGAPVYLKGGVSPKWSDDGRGVSSVMSFGEATAAKQLASM